MQIFPVGHHNSHEMTEKILMKNLLAKQEREIEWEVQNDSKGIVEPGKCQKYLKQEGLGTLT